MKIWETHGISRGTGMYGTSRRSRILSADNSKDNIQIVDYITHLQLIILKQTKQNKLSMQPPSVNRLCQH